MNRSARGTKTARFARRWLALGVAPLLVLGCASDFAERDFYDHKTTTTLLRTQLDDGRPVPRGFQHPVEITEERLRRILATLEVRIDEPFVAPEEKPAIARELLGDVARALSESLAAANANEEVALMVVRKSRYLGVFSEETLTTFVAYVKDDLLTISLSRVDWNLLQQRSSASNRPKLPKPYLGKEQMDFRVVQNPDYEAAGRQAVAIRYADPRWGVTGKATTQAAAEASETANGDAEPAAVDEASPDPSPPTP